MEVSRVVVVDDGRRRCGNRGAEEKDLYNENREGGQRRSSNIEKNGRTRTISRPNAPLSAIIILVLVSLLLSGTITTITSVESLASRSVPRRKHPQQQQQHQRRPASSGREDSKNRTADPLRILPHPPLAAAAAAAASSTRQIADVDGIRTKLAEWSTQNSQNIHNMTGTRAECDALLADGAATEQWDLVLQVLQRIKQEEAANNSNPQLPQQNTTCAQACLEACFQADNAARNAQQILSALRQAGLPPDANDCVRAVLSMCSRHDQSAETSHGGGGGWRTALAMLQEMVVVPSDNTGDPHESYNEWCDDLPVAAYDAILAGMLQDREWKEAVRLLRFMQQQQQQQQPSPPSSKEQQQNKTRPALSTYRTVIECCVAANQAEQAAQVLQSCISSNNKQQHEQEVLAAAPSPPTMTLYAPLFELVIVALCRKLQWRRSLALLDQMDTLHVPTNVPMYNAILTACSKANEVGAAKSLLVRMTRRDRNPQLNRIQPTVISYNAVMAVCARNAQWRDALRILDQVHRAPGIEPDVYTYTK